LSIAKNAKVFSIFSTLTFFVNEIRVKLSTVTEQKRRQR
jgi:hypothetical protein